MGLCFGKTDFSSSAPWPDLPPDLAGLILSHLPSHDDRLSFGAVCRGWRLATQQQRPMLPPAMPCISLGDGAYQSIADCKVFRSSCSVVSFGNRLMYKHHGRIYLRDPLSSSTIEIPRHYHLCADGCDDGGSHDPCSTGKAWLLIDAGGIVNAMQKVVVCSPYLVAAIVYPAAGRLRGACRFAFCRPGTAGQLSWALCNPEHLYKDMALYRGKIFALNFREELFVHELGQPGRAEHVITKRLPPQSPSGFIFNKNHHMVVSSDGRKLLMVRWSISRGNQMNLHVFEADLERREWSEVKDLDGDTLFLSKTCSRAISRLSTELYDQRFRGGNRVFILGIDWQWARVWAQTRSDDDEPINGVPSYCVYDMMSGTLSLASTGSGHWMLINLRSEWFFPSE